MLGEALKYNSAAQRGAGAEAMKRNAGRAHAGCRRCWVNRIMRCTASLAIPEARGAVCTAEPGLEGFGKCQHLRAAAQRGPAFRSLP